MFAFGFGGRGMRSGLLKEWFTAFEYAYGNQGGYLTGYTIRHSLASSALTKSGDRIRISIKAGSGGMGCNPVYIGEAASEGSYNFLAPPVQVFFNGGSPSFSIGANETIVSDPISLPLDSSKPLLVSWFLTSGTGPDIQTGSGLMSAYAAGNTAANQTGGYGGSSTWRRGLAKVEVEQEVSGFAGARFWRWRPIVQGTYSWDIRTNNSSSGTNGIWASPDGSGTNLGVGLSYDTHYKFRNANGSDSAENRSGNPWSSTGSYGGMLEDRHPSSYLWFAFDEPVIIGSIDVGNPSFNSHDRFPPSMALEYQEVDTFTGDWVLWGTLNSASGNATKSYRNIADGAVITAT